MPNEDNKDKLNTVRQPGERNVLDDHREENRAKFKISQQDRGLAGSNPLSRNGSLLELDPKDFENKVEAEAIRKKRNRVILVASIVAVIGIFVWGVTSLFPTNKIDTSDPAQVASSDQPFYELYPDAPSANKDQMTLTSDGNVLQTIVGEGLGAKLAVATDKTFADLPNCKVTKASDFALCASTTPDSPFSGTGVWLTKDAVHSNLFSQAEDFKPVTVKGSAAAAVMKLNGLAPEPRAALVIVSDDSAGYIITLPADQTVADAKKLAANVFVE